MKKEEKKLKCTNFNTTSLEMKSPWCSADLAKKNIWIKSSLSWTTDFRTILEKLKQIIKLQLLKQDKKDLRQQLPSLEEEVMASKSQLSKMNLQIYMEGQIWLNVKRPGRS